MELKQWVTFRFAPQYDPHFSPLNAALCVQEFLWITYQIRKSIKL